MQKLERDGVYAAEWGGYVVKLTLSGGVARAHLLRDGADGNTAESPAHAAASAAEAMTWAAEQGVVPHAVEHRAVQRQT